MDRYEINENTIAVIGISDELSKVYEVDRSFYVTSSANVIMDESCKYFGSSLNGRKEGTKFLMGVYYKPPIIVEESMDIIFFPTCSLRKGLNSWVSFKYVNNFYRVLDKCVILFNNNLRLVFNCSFEVISNQIMRSARLESILRTRKKG